jgi:hypothetical protein
VTENTHPDYLVLTLYRDILYQRANDTVLIDSLKDIIIYAQDRLCELGKRDSFDTVTKEGKNYFGVCLEERLRDDVFKLPQGKHDLNIKPLFSLLEPSKEEEFIVVCAQAGVNNYYDLDFKNSINGINDTIPPECMNDVCFMIADSRHSDNVSFGLFIAKDEYLRPCANSGPGRDKKRGLNANGRSSILWLKGPRTEPKIRRRRTPNK